MNILVTGCMGFIGSNLVPKLLNAGNNVIGFDNLESPSINPTNRMKEESKQNWERFIFFNIDINKPEQMHSILANCVPDIIIHLAALGSVPRSFDTPIATMQTNAIGFINVLQMAHIFNSKKFIYASSSSVYGDSKSYSRTEGSEGKALSPYALSKQANEQIAELLSLQMKTKLIGLRFFNVYGPGQSLRGQYSPVIPVFCTSEKPVVYGDGTQVRDFTYVDDVCEAIMLSIGQPINENHTVLNVGKGMGNSLIHILRLLEKTEVDRKEERFGDVKFSIADTRLAKEIIGFEAKTSIEDGLKKTKAFYEKFNSQQE